MLLALLSDTHDNAAITKAALARFVSYKPDIYLHAGDLVSPDMLPLFAGLPFHFVFGNNEYDLPALRSLASSLDLHCHDHFAALTFAGKRIALLHGHDHSLFNRILRPASTPAGDFHYIIHGHTHERRDDRLPNRPHSRIINPGAVHRTRAKSVALLDLSTDTLTFLDL